MHHFDTANELHLWLRFNCFMDRAVELRNPVLPHSYLTDYVFALAFWCRKAE